MKSLGKVLLTGATGLIGQQLSLALLTKGWKLVILGRRPEAAFRKEFSLPCDYFQWKDSTTSLPPPEALDVTAVINLMGELIAGRRWTKLQKAKLRDSRVLSTRNLVAGLKQHVAGIQVFVSGSAIGYYGDAKDQWLDEQTPASSDFLGSLCKDWELEAQSASGRCTQIRTGIVLANNGGALSKIVPLFECGLGGRLANGQQWMSWIHIHDMVRILIEALENPKMQGPINAVALAPVTNKEFAQTLAEQLKVRAFFPVPKPVLQLAMGEMAQLVLFSQRVRPKALETAGFQFDFPTLESALKDLYCWKKSRHDRRFQAYQWVPRPRDTVFSFFSDEKNLEMLMPEFLNFHVLKKSTQQVEEGTVIDYQLKIHGILTRWSSRIVAWNPGHQFQDIQIRGPYNKWDHTHRFEDFAGGTLIKDEVIYRLPLAGRGGEFAAHLVRNDINKIFNFRQKKISELFQ